MSSISDYENKSWDEWDNGELGRSEDHAQISQAVDEAIIDGALELESISLRMPKGLLEDLKLIALLHSTGYQPLMKQVLQRFVTAETKQILRDAADKKAARKELIAMEEQLVIQEPMKKTA